MGTAVAKEAGRTGSVISLYLLSSSLYGTASPSTQRKDAAAISKILSSIYSSVRSKMPLPLQLCRVNPDGPGGISIFTLQRRENIFFLNYADFFPKRLF
jgi:hypothetical protein